MNEGFARSAAEILAQLPAPVRHFEDLSETAVRDRLQRDQAYRGLLREKLEEKWFAALVPHGRTNDPSITARFETWRGLIEFIQEHDALVEVWAYGEGGFERARRIPASELAQFENQPREQPTFVTVTYPDRAAGRVRQERIEFGFQAAQIALEAARGFQRQRQLQLAVHDILRARDAGGHPSAGAQQQALDRAIEERRLPGIELATTPVPARDLWVAAEYEVDDLNNFSRWVRFYRESEIQKHVRADADGRTTQVIRLRTPGEKQPREASAFSVRGTTDELQPEPAPLPGRDVVELRVTNPDQPEVRRWNVLEFGEPELLKQSALARFSLINAHLDRQRKIIGLRKSKYDLIAEPILAAMNIGGGLAGVGFPIGEAGRLAYNLISSRLIADVPTVKEMRELFAALAARETIPNLKTKPADFLTEADLKVLTEAGRSLSDAAVQEYLERISDDDLRAILKLGRLARHDARITNFLNILTSAGKVSGVTESGLLRDIFNSPYFALNGDINLKTILAVALGQRVLTPFSGTSLESLSRGEGPAKAWAQFFDVSVDLRAVVNTVSRLTKGTLARKELDKPFPYAPRTTDLAAYEVRIFGFPLLLFYKRGLMREDLQAFENDYAYGMIGARLVEHFPTQADMEAEIRAGRMAPLGFVRVWNGKDGWKETSLAVFAHRIPQGRHQGKTSIIIYGLKAYAGHSQFIDRELSRFQQYEQALHEGAVIEQRVEAREGPFLGAPASLPASLHLDADFAGKDAGAPRFMAPMHVQSLEVLPSPEPGWGETPSSRGIPADGSVTARRSLAPPVQGFDAGVLSPRDFEPIIHVGEKAREQIFTPLLSDLLEVRRYWLRRSWGLPLPVEELPRVATILENLAARNIWLDDADPLAGVDKFNSTFFYRSRLQDGSRVVKMTLIPSLAEIDRAVRKREESARIEQIRRDAISATGAGVVLINRVTEVEGRSEMGPLVDDPQGQVIGVGVASGALAVEKILGLVDSLPVLDRARLQFNHFAATIVNLDLKGDGTNERVFLTIEFPAGSVVRRERIHPTTGQSEILSFEQGLWKRTVTADRITDLEYDDLRRETRSQTYFNQGTLAAAVRGPLLEETRTLATWFRDLNRPDLDPSSPLIAKVRVNFVTGQMTRETYGLFPLPVSVADDQSVTENRFDPRGQFESAQVVENGAQEADFQRDPVTRVREPIRGRDRFRFTAVVPDATQSTNSSAARFKTTVQRTDLATGLSKILQFDHAHSGRIERESSVDAFDGSRSFPVTATREYRDDFHFGLIPHRSAVTAGVGGRLISEIATLHYDPSSRRMVGIETSYTGRVTTNTWDFRWEKPVEVESALRRTVTQYNRDETRATGWTLDRSNNEEVARFAVQYEPTPKRWRLERVLWHRSGVTNRMETVTLSGLGKVMATRTADLLEARPGYDAGGFEESCQLSLRNPATGRFDLPLVLEDDYRWAGGGRDARIQTFVEGRPYDQFRRVTDDEGRTITEGVRERPGFNSRTLVTYDGASDRVLGSEEFQQNVLRVTRRVLPEQRQPDGTFHVPVTITPQWGLVSTQILVLGDPFGRPQRIDFENGESAVAREWFEGTALAKVSETLDRRGRVKERYVRRLLEGTENGQPFDRTARLTVDRWNKAALADEAALVPGTDLAIFQDSAGQRTYFDGSKPFRVPLYTIDPAGEDGVAVTVGSLRRSRVTALVRSRLTEARATDPNQPPEPMLELETLDLRGLFFQTLSRRTLDRSGKVLAETLSQVPTLAEPAYTDQALWEKASRAKLAKLFQYRYDRGWLIPKPDPATGGRQFLFTTNSSDAGPTAIPVNDGRWREFVTQVEGRQVPLADEPDRSEGPSLFQRMHSPTERERNPYLPERVGAWVSWIATELGADGRKVFDTEMIFDAEGRLSVARTFKSTRSGEAATKISYQIPPPTSGAFKDLILAPGERSAAIEIPGPSDFSASDFLYLYLVNPSNAVWSVVLTDQAGRQVKVSREDISPGNGVAPTWPVNGVDVRWLPDALLPRHGAVVDGPTAWLRERNVVAISVHDLALAGLDITRVSAGSLQIRSPGEIPLRISPLYRLVRGGPFLEDEGSRHVFHVEERHGSGLRMSSTGDRRQSDRELFASQRTKSVVQFNGRPVAVTLDRGRHTAFPPVVVLDTSDTESPRPLYALAYENGRFVEHYRTRRLGDIQVYTIVQGFDLPRFEVFDPSRLEDELGAGLMAYGYDYHVTIRYAQGGSWLTRPWAALHNRIVANAFKYGSDRLLNLFSEVDAQSERLRRYNYALLHNARLQSDAIQELPMLAQALLPTRDVPWKDRPATNTTDLPVEPKRLALDLLRLHVATNLPATYLIPTAPKTAAARFVETAREAELIKLAVTLGEHAMARELLEFYWQKSHGGEKPLHASYDAQAGTAMALDFMFERPHHARPTADAQLAMADAAFSLGLKLGDGRWLGFGQNLLSNVLTHFRPPASTNQAPRGIGEFPILPVWSSPYGLTFWPEAARYPLHGNARAFLLLKQLENLPRSFAAPPAWRDEISRARAEQEAWLKSHVLPQVEKTGVAPLGLFQIQDINAETTALGVERSTSAEGWLTFLEAAHAMSLPAATTRRWLENLARVHGVEIGGRWGLDWSLPLLRADAISPELTAHFVRVARLIGHGEAERFGREAVLALRRDRSFPVVVTEARRTLPLLSGQGFSIYPTLNRQAWPDTFAVHAQLAASSWATSRVAGAASNSVREIEPAPRTDWMVFILLTAGFYLAILGASTFWWRFRALRKPESAAAAAVPTQIVPDGVMQRAEERWSKRVLGVQTPLHAEHTRFSNATLEQNFLMQLRAIYKLVLEWRRQENGWDEEDPRLAEDETDDWLNGLDEFASVVGLYMRFVIKAGVKDGFRQKDVLSENEDSNHIWSRLLMYFAEYYWGLLTLMTSYNNLVTAPARVALYSEISQLLNAMGMRQRAAGFDARTLFNYPANPLAFDLLVVQKPGATLSKILLEASMKLKIPYTHLAGFVEKYKAFKRRENPNPIHPYLIELGKILPHFLLMGLGALVWYNQGIGDSPIVPYVWTLLSQLALDPANLTWGLPLAGGLVLTVLAHFTRIYRFEGSMLMRERAPMILDATLTSLFIKKYLALPQIKPGAFWDADLYERCSWALRATGFLGLGWRLLWEPTPSFATFLVVKGLLAMLAFVEVAGIVFPLAATALSKYLQDRVTFQPKTGRIVQFLNRLNLTATQPASPAWLSIKYHSQPTVPSGDFRGMTQAIVFYFVLAGTFFVVGGYLCQQIFSLWFTDMYLNAANWKLFFGCLLFWNTMYLLRYGLFLMFTGLASLLATFPIRTAFGLLASLWVLFIPFAEALHVDIARHSAAALGVAAMGAVLILFESPILNWLRRVTSSSANASSGPAETKRELERIKADRSATLGVVYMGGDDLSYQKLTPALLMSRWTILRDKLDSPALGLLGELAGRPDDPTLEEWFRQLYELEKRSDVTLWHPMQITVAGETPRLAPELGLNLSVESEAQRQVLLSAWHIRRWLVTMMSTAGHAQDTGVTLVDIALRLGRDGLGANTVFYLIQNKYDNNDNNRPVQTPYDRGELGQRNKLARLLAAVAPGARAYSVQNWTPFGFKAGGLTGMDLVHEETMRLTSMLVLDRNATVHDLDALMEDLAQALTDPDLIIVIPGRGTTNTLTPIGQASQLVEEGHRSFLKGLMTCLGGTASESVGTGWGNLLAVFYGRVQRAMVDSATPKMPLTSRMRRGSSFAVRVEGLIGFAPHAVGISEDTWAVSQAAHNAVAFGQRVKYKLSRAFWHKIRETWSHAEWLASFPRWSGGFVQMMHDPIMQRINDFGPASVFSKEIRANSGRNFLSAPFALLNILFMPLAIMLDVTPFVQILIVLWNFGFIMNQILTVHGLNTYLESSGFHRGPAILGGLLAGLASFSFPLLRPMAPGWIVLGVLYGGFVVGLNRWLYTRVRDVILFGPQLVLHTLGQIVRQSMEFTLSGASPEDAKSVNMSFRTWAGPREDQPLNGFPNFINLKTVVWVVGLLSVILNLFALANLDLLNVLLLLPSLLFSVSALVGPFILRPKVGRPIGWRVGLAKTLGWLAAIAFYTLVSAWIARGGGLLWLGTGLLVGILGLVARHGLKYAPYRSRWRRTMESLSHRLIAAGLAAPEACQLARKLGQQTGGDPAKVQAVLNDAAVPESQHAGLVAWVQECIPPLLRQPVLDMGADRWAQNRFVSEFQRAFVLALFVLIWFFIVPVPGLFVFRAGEYRVSLEMATILSLVCGAIGVVLIGSWLGRLVQWFDRRGIRTDGLNRRLESAFGSFTSLRAAPGRLTDQEVSSLHALFTDVETYLDQRSYTYARRSLSLIETTLRSVANR